MEPEQPMVVNGKPVSGGPGGRNRILSLFKSRRNLRVTAAVAGCVLVIGGIVLVLATRNKDLSIPSASVQLGEGGFVPSTVQIDRGQGVTWVNKDKLAHQVFADQTAAPHLDSVDMLLTGDSYTYVFEKPGTYHYYDPADTKQFQGTVIVK